MIVNISTNTPVFHVQGLSSGTEYRVQIYSVQNGGKVSKHAAFETFTLQVICQQSRLMVTIVSNEGSLCCKIEKTEIIFRLKKCYFTYGRYL